MTEPWQEHPWQEQEIGVGGCARVPEDPENEMARLEFQVLDASQPIPIIIRARPLRPLAHSRVLRAALNRLL